MDSRTQEIEQRNRIFSSKNEPGIDALVALLSTQIERIKGKLLSAAPAEVERLQGEAAAYLRVAKWVNEPITLPIDKP